MDPLPGNSPVGAARTWAGLDGPWREAFRQAWEALRTGNIAVGACAATADGEIVHAARNRLNDDAGPDGEVFGSTLAHAEINVLARLRYPRSRDLVLTTTLEPCLQCAGAIRLSSIATVRFAGEDLYWAGCHEFGKLSPREALRTPPVRIGPRRDELGAFATLMARFAQPRTSGFEATLRTMGEGPLLDLAHELKAAGEVDRIAGMEVDAALAYLWPRLQELVASGAEP